MKKYKVKIKKIYIYNKKIKINYIIYIYKEKERKYTLCETGAGVPLKKFFIYWFDCNFKHQLNIRF